MIYFNKDTGQFEPHLYIATYINNQDDVVREKYTNDKEFWESFVAKWGRDLTFSNLSLSQEQQDRLAVLNNLNHCCDGWDSHASLFVEHGAILPVDAAPYLKPIASDYEAETLAWANVTYNQEFTSLQEFADFLQLNSDTSE